MVDIECRYVSACSNYEDLESSTIEDIVERNRELQPPEEFPYRDVVIEKDPEEYDVLYSESSLEAPTYPLSHSAVEANMADGDRYHVHSYLGEEYFDAGLSLHEELFPVDDEIELAHITPTLQVDLEFKDLINRFSTVEPGSEDLSLLDISFTAGDRELQFSSRPEESSISIPFNERRMVQPDEIQETVLEKVEEARDHFGELIE